VTTGLRERKKLATRAALHRAALELVADRGLDAVSVEDIAAAADVSYRTFFNYFAGKDDAVIGFAPSDVSHTAEAFAARPTTESPVEALRAVLRERATVMAEDTELWPLRLRVVHENPALRMRLGAGFAEADRVLADAIAERTGTAVATDVYPTLLAAVQSAVMRTAMHRWHMTEFTASLPDLVDEAWDVVVAGLPAPSA
jgi:AcrR family transcriptional regulator